MLIKRRIPYVPKRKNQYLLAREMQECPEGIESGKRAGKQTSQK